MLLPKHSVASPMKLVPNVRDIQSYTGVIIKKRKKIIKNCTSESSLANSPSLNSGSEPGMETGVNGKVTVESPGWAELSWALSEDVALGNSGILRSQVIPTCVCLYFYCLSFALLPLRLLGLVTRKYGNSHPIKLKNIRKVKHIQVALTPWEGIRFPGISVKVPDCVNQIRKWELLSLKPGVICQGISFQGKVCGG